MIHAPRAGIVIELAGAGEDNKSDLSITKYGKLLSLLKQPVSPLRKRHLPARRIVNPPDHNLPSPHLFLLLLLLLQPIVGFLSFFSARSASKSHS